MLKIAISATGFTAAAALNVKKSFQANSNQQMPGPGQSWDNQGQGGMQGMQGQSWNQQNQQQQASLCDLSNAPQMSQEMIQGEYVNGWMQFQNYCGSELKQCLFQAPSCFKNSYCASSSQDYSKWVMYCQSNGGSAWCIEATPQVQQQIDQYKQMLWQQQKACLPSGQAWSNADSSGNTMQQGNNMMQQGMNQGMQGMQQGVRGAPGAQASWSPSSSSGSGSSGWQPKN